MRKLLVATRNTTNPDGTSSSTDTTTQTSESTSAISGSSTTTSRADSDIVSENPIDPSEPLGNADEIFRLDEDGWDKPNTTQRENPVIDLFLHSPIAHNNDTEPSPNASFTKDETSGIPVGHDPVVIFPDSSVDENKTETTIAHPLFPHVVPTIPAEVEPSVINHVEEKPVPPPLVEEDKTESHVHETLSALQDIYTLIQENLGVPNEEKLSISHGNTAFYGGDRTPYRLDPKSIHQFHCERGTNLEFCKVSSEFLYQLSENSGKDFQLTYDKVPMYFIPKKDQLKFYLLSNLMLQNGVTDEIAIPLILSGLSSEQEWVKLDKSFFGDSRTELTTGETTPSKYPLFNSSAAVLYPADLNTIVSDPKIQKIFCLKYLLRILKS